MKRKPQQGATTAANRFDPVQRYRLHVQYSTYRLAWEFPGTPLSSLLPFQFFFLHCFCWQMSSRPDLIYSAQGNLVLLCRLLQFLPVSIYHLPASRGRGARRKSGRLRKFFLLLLSRDRYNAAYLSYYCLWRQAVTDNIPHNFVRTKHNVRMSKRGRLSASRELHKTNKEYRF